MFGFSKTKEPEIKEFIENEITVSIPDIKSYLVREYEKAKELNKIIENKDKEIEDFKEMKMKYEATLVTLNEYSNRLSTADRDIQSLRTNAEYKDKRILGLSRELNDYRLKSSSLDQMRDQIYSEGRITGITAAINAVRGLSGNISKNQIIDLLEKIKKPEENK